MFKINHDGKEVAELKIDRKKDNASLIYLSDMYDTNKNLEILRVFNQFLNHNNIDLGEIQTISKSVNMTRPSGGFPRDIGENIVSIKRRTHNLFVTEKERDEMLLHGISISGSYFAQYGIPYITNVNNKENMIIDGQTCKFFLRSPDDLKGKNILFITDEDDIHIDFILGSSFKEPVSFPNIQVHNMNYEKHKNISLYISERTTGNVVSKKTEFDFSDLDANLSNLSIRSKYSKMQALWFTKEEIEGRIRTLETLNSNPIISREHYRNSAISLNKSLGLDESDVPVNHNNATDVYTARNYIDTMSSKIEELNNKKASPEPSDIK